MTNLLQLIFSSAGEDGYVELSIGGVHRKHRRWVSVAQGAAFEVVGGQGQAFFGPAVRKQSGILGKDNVLRSNVVWVDIDDASLPVPVAPPTAIVNSGNGWHMYWLMNRHISKIDAIDRINKAAADSVNADDCFNADRIMRIPGSINDKDPEHPLDCLLVNSWPERIYDPKDLYASFSLPGKVVRKIVTGDCRGFHSRSDRDWYIVRALVAAGISDSFIYDIFRLHTCGDKYRDPATNGAKYLDRTIEKARESREAQGKPGSKSALIVEDEDGYYLVSDRGRLRLSTFIIHPKVLLEAEDMSDSIMCDITAAGSSYTWTDEVISIASLVSAATFNKSLKRAAWIWFGRDAETHLLQMYLVQKLQDAGMPRSVAVTVEGLYSDEHRSYFVAADCIYGSDGSTWQPANSPVVLLNTGREMPQLSLASTVPMDESELAELATLLPQINRDGAIWPLIGWFMAAPMKTRFEELQYRFPVLNVFGTRGSGKTTTILRVFHPMLGYAQEQSYDSNTTRFVALSLLGSTNAVPIAFSEFRISGAEGFTRYVLLSYDTGRDPRGRPDQTTTDYPLLAPFTIDGEDMLADSASLERAITVQMNPSDISEGSDCYSAFDQLQSMRLHGFAPHYLQFILRVNLPLILDAAEQEIYEAFPQSLPNRIRRNLIVAWCGVLTLDRYLKRYGLEMLPDEGAAVMRESLHNVYSAKLGRAPTEADAFMETIINGAARGTRVFPWVVDADRLFWFQLAPAYDFYISARLRQRRASLSSQAIRAQILEMQDEYTVDSKIMVIQGKKVLAYGINLQNAHRSGLDIPTEFHNVFIISGGE